MDLRTTYMGLKLKNPIAASSSPLSDSVGKIKQLEDAGAGAVVMFSVFEEQLRQETAALEDALTAGTNSFAESLSYLPSPGDFSVKPDAYLKIIEEAVEDCEIPIIGSLNGISNEGWINYAKHIEQAGAKGLELNIYWLPTDLTLPGSEVEQRYLDIIQAVKSSVKIPVALKMNPFFSSIANFAHRVDQIGVDALVLFNRFYQPDFDIEEREVAPHLKLSTPYEIRLPLLWIAMLYGRVNCSLGASRGVQSATEVIKYVMAGADAVMTASALLHHDIPFVGTMLKEMEEWMQKNEYESVEQMKGCMSQQNVAEPTMYERANYLKTLGSYKSILSGNV